MYGLGLIIVLYFYVKLAMWLAKKLASKHASRQWKLGAWIAVVLAFVLIPSADSIVGRVYFNHLCNTEAGVKVYQTVELPAENWDNQGKPKFYDEKNGNSYPIAGFDGGWNSYFDKNFYSESQTEKHSKVFHIDKHSYKLQDKLKTKTFAEQKSFMYWGGWLARNFSPHDTAISCGNTLEESNDFHRKLYKPANSK